MSSLEEVLTAHQGRPARQDTGQWMCACKWLSVAPNDGGGRGDVEWREHFVEAVAAAGLAVIQLPADTKPYRVEKYADFDDNQIVGEVWDDDFNTSYSPMEARILAARLLAAASAAEAVES